MKKYLILIFLTTFITSCDDFLNPEPTAAIPFDDFYTDGSEVELGLVAIYDAIQGVNDSQFDENRGIQLEYFVAEMYSDNTSTRSVNANDVGSAAQFESFSVQPTNEISANYYASMFRVIYLSNVILDSIKLGVVENGADESRYEAEAKFLRAYAYFNLIRLYGEQSTDLGLPYLDHVLGDEETTTQFTRVSINQIYELIISDLTTATEGLDDSYKTRASKSAAHTLLAKVYLTIEVPNYAEAISNLDSVYGNFELEPNYADIFDYNNELNDEIIFAIGFEDNLVNDSQNFSFEFTNQGNASGLNYLTFDLQAKLFLFGGSNRYLVDEDDNDSTLKYATDKFSTTTGTESEFGGFDWIVLRYADVILMYAEANMAGANELNISSYPWATDYNLIRTRAGLEAVTTVTKTELLDERRFEFFTENHRLFDLKRFGLAQQILSSFAATQGFQLNDGEVGTLPIPLNEVNISPVGSDGNAILVQNSFWD